MVGNVPQVSNFLAITLHLYRHSVPQIKHCPLLHPVAHNPRHTCQSSYIHNPTQLYTHSPSHAYLSHLRMYAHTQQHIAHCAMVLAHTGFIQVTSHCQSIVLLSNHQSHHSINQLSASVGPLRTILTICLIIVFSQPQHLHHYGGLCMLKKY